MSGHDKFAKHDTAVDSFLKTFPGAAVVEVVTHDPGCVAQRRRAYDAGGEMVCTCAGAVCTFCGELIRTTELDTRHEVTGWLPELKPSGKALALRTSSGRRAHGGCVERAKKVDPGQERMA